MRTVCLGRNVEWAVGIVLERSHSWVCSRQVAAEVVEMSEMPRKCVSRVREVVGEGGLVMKYREREEKEGFLQRNPHQVVEAPEEGIAREGKGGAVSSGNYSHRVSNYEFT